MSGNIEVNVDWEIVPDSSSNTANSWNEAEENWASQTISGSVPHSGTETAIRLPTLQDKLEEELEKNGTDGVRDALVGVLGGLEQEVLIDEVLEDLEENADK